MSNWQDVMIWNNIPVFTQGPGWGKLRHLVKTISLFWKTIIFIHFVYSGREITAKLQSAFDNQRYINNTEFA